MNETEIQERLVEIEMALDNQSKSLDDLNDIVIKQGKIIDYLLKQNQLLQNMLSADVVKPMQDETPPPHY